MVLVKNAPEISDAKPIKRNRKMDLVKRSLKRLFSFGASLKTVNMAIITSKKSSSLMDTYMPGILRKGNFGYRGTIIRSATARYFDNFSDKL